MKNYFLILFLSIIGCSEISYTLDDTNNVIAREKISDRPATGSYCGSGCIWSTFAITNNLQQIQETCNTGACACVVSGDANTLCESAPQAENYTNLQVESSEIPDVPYYNQYNNKNFGWATCQNTSIAMVLTYFGDTIHPDEIFDRWGKDYAQSPAGLNEVYASYSTSSSILTKTNATESDLKNALDEGAIVIVHGYFTRSGHVLVVRGYDNSGYYVNDPAGVWSECFKCGYSGSMNGITKYNKSSFYSAVFTSNGSSFLPGWIHIIKIYN